MPFGVGKDAPHLLYLSACSARDACGCSPSPLSACWPPTAACGCTTSGCRNRPTPAGSTTPTVRLLERSRCAACVRTAPRRRPVSRPGDRIVAIDGVPLDRYRVFLDAFGRRPAGARVVAAGDAGGRIAPCRVSAHDGARRARRKARSSSASMWWLGTALTGYPLIFLAVASAVLLQRPGDRAAWVMALAFGGLIAGAPLLLFEPQMPPPLRRFMVPVWAFLISTMATALFYFFTVFPAPSPIDRRVPWLKRVLGVRGARGRHDTRRRVLRHRRQRRAQVDQRAPAAHAGHLGGVELQHRLHVAGAGVAGQATHSATSRPAGKRASSWRARCAGSGRSPCCRSCWRRAAASDLTR